MYQKPKRLHGRYLGFRKLFKKKLRQEALSVNAKDHQKFYKAMWDDGKGPSKEELKLIDEDYQIRKKDYERKNEEYNNCLLYTSPSPRD